MDVGMFLGIIEGACVLGPRERNECTLSLDTSVLTYIGICIYTVIPFGNSKPLSGRRSIDTITMMICRTGTPGETSKNFNVDMRSATSHLVRSPRNNSRLSSVQVVF